MTGRLLRIVLIRHGQPAIALAPSTNHHGFRDYIGAYEAAGLDASSLPPRELDELRRELTAVYASDRPRSHQSARALVQGVEPVLDPLFAEAPLASPPFPLLKLSVPWWAVISRLLWHLGFSPGIEGSRAAWARAQKAADMLIAKAQERAREGGRPEKSTGTVALVAHGYFNWMIGRVLARQGFVRRGSHRARYWNTVIYERQDG
jgi:broad specificity phosphatase PhoE